MLLSMEKALTLIKKDVLKGSKKKNNHANNDAKTH
jgi:hypothetical protein